MIDEKIETSIVDGMKVFPGEPFIRFSVKANDTEENKKIHDAFKKYCQIECDNNYTLGLKQLLTIVESDYKFEALHSLITDLNERVMKLETSKIEVKVEKKKDNEAF